MHPVVIVINGPRRTGKDTAATAMADWLTRAGASVQIVPFALQLKYETLRSWNQPLELLEVFEQMKDEPAVAFGGMSWRQALINHAEYQRGVHGDDYYSEKWRAETVTLFAMGLVDVVVAPDCRFEREIAAASDVGGKHCTLLYHIYRAPGLHKNRSAWDGDIGDWHFPDVADVPQIALINDRTIEDLQYVAGVTAQRFYRSCRGTAPL